jgi:hypothetical protein
LTDKIVSLKDGGQAEDHASGSEQLLLVEGKPLPFDPDAVKKLNLKKKGNKFLKEQHHGVNSWLLGAKRLEIAIFALKKIGYSVKINENAVDPTCDHQITFWTDYKRITSSEPDLICFKNTEQTFVDVTGQKLGVCKHFCDPQGRVFRAKLSFGKISWALENPGKVMYIAYLFDENNEIYLINTRKFIEIYMKTTLFCEICNFFYLSRSTLNQISEEVIKL